MLRYNRIAQCISIGILTAIAVSAQAQDTDPYKNLTASYSPVPANLNDEITLSLNGELPNSCFGHSVSGFPSVDPDSMIFEIRVVVSFCDVCTTPSSPFAYSFPIGQIPPGEHSVTYRIVEEFRCAGGNFDSVSYDTAYVYDTLQIGTIGCPVPCDINGDSFVDIVDVVTVIRTAFRGEASPGNACDPMPDDLNCDASVNVIDVILIVNTVFRGGTCPGC